MVPHGRELKCFGGFDFGAQILFPGHVAVNTVGPDRIPKFSGHAAGVGAVTGDAPFGEQGEVSPL